MALESRSLSFLNRGGASMIEVQAPNPEFSIISGTGKFKVGRIYPKNPNPGLTPECPEAPQL